MDEIRFPSTSRKNQSYSVKLDTTGYPIDCDCAGYQHRQNCKHIEVVQAGIVTGGERIVSETIELPEEYLKRLRKIAVGYGWDHDVVILRAISAFLAEWDN